MGKQKIDGKINDLKDQICGYFLNYLIRSKGTQQVLAKKLKLNGALLSKIIRHQHEEFTLDRLLRLLNLIRPDLNLVLKKINRTNESLSKKQ